MVNASSEVDFRGLERVVCRESDSKEKYTWRVWAVTLFGSEANQSRLCQKLNPRARWSTAFCGCRRHEIGWTYRSHYSSLPVELCVLSVQVTSWNTITRITYQIITLRSGRARARWVSVTIHQYSKHFQKRVNLHPVDRNRFQIWWHTVRGQSAPCWCA